MSEGRHRFRGRRSLFFGGLAITVAAVRALVFYHGQPQFVVAAVLLVGSGAVYLGSSHIPGRFGTLHRLHFALQVALVVAITNLRPFLDVSVILYLPLFMQAFAVFSRPAAMAWMTGLALALGATLVVGIGWAAGLALGLGLLGAASFLVSYELLSAQKVADEAASQALLVELRQAHQTLQEQAVAAEELAAARERNRLARELHDSVSQLVFAIVLTSQSARLLLDREPERVPEQLDRLGEMTGSALSELRSLIAQLRPPQRA